MFSGMAITKGLKANISFDLWDGYFQNLSYNDYSNVRQKIEEIINVAYNHTITKLKLKVTPCTFIDANPNTSNTGVLSNNCRGINIESTYNPSIDYETVYEWKEAIGSLAGSLKEYFGLKYVFVDISECSLIEY